MRAIFALLGGMMIYGGAAVSLHAQTTTPASSGVYTAKQAARGLALYESKCAECHGPDLSGGGTSPALIGPDFTSSWSGKPVAALFHAIRTSMPSDHPGTLTAQQTADLIAFFLKVNGYPPGKTELLPDEDLLKSILINSAP